MDILNLYAGIGGNRKLWDEVKDEINVTAIEWDSDKADVYRDYFPDDIVIETDAHAYLLKHFRDYDFIWGSPPCPTHSKTQIMSVLSENEGAGCDSRTAQYPDMRLYQEIILLDNFGSCDWVVENVQPYYEPLMQGTRVGRHLFWSNFPINVDFSKSANVKDAISDVESQYGYDLSSYGFDDKRKVVRNCVDPKLGKRIFEAATVDRQATLF